MLGRRGEGGGEKREGGHNVPKTLVVHLLLNKVGQGHESERPSESERERKRGDQVA